MPRQGGKGRGGWHLAQPPNTEQSPAPNVLHPLLPPCCSSKGLGAAATAQRCRFVLQWPSRRGSVFGYPPPQQAGTDPRCRWGYPGATGGARRVAAPFWVAPCGIYKPQIAAPRTLNRGTRAWDTCWGCVACPPRWLRARLAPASCSPGCSAKTCRLPKVPRCVLRTSLPWPRGCSRRKAAVQGQERERREEETLQSFQLCSKLGT